MYANRNTGITYNSHGNLEPVCYYDSGYNQKHLGTKPQYSYIIMWAGAAIIWKSKRHKSTPNSVSEAEFMTLGHATRWILWLRKVITDMGFGEWVNRPTLMVGDNRNARDWANEPMITDGNRAIEREYITVREKVVAGQILPVWIETDRNCSDLGTKSQVKPTLTEQLNRIACGLEEMPLPLGHKILFGPVEKPVLRGNPRGMDAVEHPVIATLRAERSFNHKSKW